MFEGYQVGFLLSIGGMLLILEGATAGMAKLTTKSLPEWAIKLIAGAVIGITGLWNMATAPYFPGFPGIP